MPALHEVRPDVDPAIDAVVRRALAPNPEERYGRSDDFARALNEQLLRSGSTLRRRGGGQLRARRSAREAFATQRQLISRVSSSPGVRRTPVPGGTLVPANTGVPMNTGRLSPLPLEQPAQAAPGTGYEATMVRPSTTATPTVGAVPAETLQLGQPASGPGRKGWTAAIALGALGLIGATAGVTSFLMNRAPEVRPPPHEWAAEGPRPGGPPMPPPHMRPPPPGMPHPPGEPQPMPEAPQAMAGAPQAPEPGTASGEAPAPVEPQDAGAAAEAEAQSEAEAQAETAQPTKPKPSESPVRAAKLVPAEHVAVMRRVPRSDYYSISEGHSAGLTAEMVLPVVAAPMKDGKARLVGEATVVVVKDRRSMVVPDARVRNAGRVDLLAVLPKAPAGRDSSGDAQPRAGTATPSAEAAPAQTPAAQRELSGRIALKSIGPFVQKIELTSTDTILWSDCILVTRGRDMYKLGGMAPGGTREVPLGEFAKGGHEVPFVGKNRLGLFCAEGHKEFPAKL